MSLPESLEVAILFAQQLYLTLLRFSVLSQLDDDRSLKMSRARICTRGCWGQFNRKFWLEFWLEKSLEFWLEITYTKNLFKMESQGFFFKPIFSIELGPCTRRSRGGALYALAEAGPVVEPDALVVTELLNGAVLGALSEAVLDNKEDALVLDALPGAFDSTVWRN